MAGKDNMPSRIRITLRSNRWENDGATWTNVRAKAQLLSVTAPIIFKQGLPTDWIKRTYVQKLKHLQTLLPPECVLEIFVEPKATPSRKSAFAQSVKKIEPRGAEPRRNRINAGYTIDDYGDVERIVTETTTTRALPQPTQRRPR